MISRWVLATITRQGVTVSGSPFWVKLRYRRLHVDPQIAPIAAHRPIQEFLIFQNRSAKITVGDFVNLAGEVLSKIIDVRQYPESLQCELQRLPYRQVPFFVPMLPTSAIGLDKSLGDIVYAASGNVFALLEPHGAAMPGTLPIGLTDRRTCYVYSTVAIALQSVLMVDGAAWLVTEQSNFWPISGDFRATATRLVVPPNGVS